MLASQESWSTQQLAEFLTVVSSFADADSTRRAAVERAAEALEAEVAAVIQPGAPVVAVGFPLGRTPTELLIEAAREQRPTIDVPLVGECHVVAVALDDDADGWLLVARHGGDHFTPQEINLLNSMARVLVLALQATELLANERDLRKRSEDQARENAKLLRELKERQSLLERLTKIQRSIVRRTVLRDVLDAIVQGAAELLGDEVVALRLRDPADPASLVLVAARGISDVTRDPIRATHVGAGASGRAVSEARLVVIDDYHETAGGHAELAAQQLQVAMAAPVQENGEVVGSLLVGSFLEGRSYGPAEREMLLAFAEHASLALTDARNFDDALHQAHHDPLTDSPNRALFLDRLEQALSRVQRSASSVAVLFVDIDYFKRVNDSLGHAAGDELLIEVARRLGGCIRPADTAARFGGDEFAVLLTDMTGPDDAVRVARRIMAALQEPFALRDREVSITASIGIAAHHDRRNDDLLRNADLALYRAKSAGRARYEWFEPEMHAAMVERMELEADLQRAVERHEFVLHYQPIVTLESGCAIAVEALVRWRHPTRGLISPAGFIPVAQENRTVLQIGRWVLGEACRQSVEWWRRLGLQRPPAVSVNLSMVQLQEPGVVEDVAAALRESGIDPGCLILEITETLLMHDVEKVSAALTQLKALGVQLAVDDFGTGYSSLQHLRSLPIDILKIAKSFVDGLGAESADATLAKAIVDLGASFRLRVIAEGIESAAQVARLRELGCELGQGFHFSRPVPAADLEHRLAAAAGAGIALERSPLPQLSES